MPRPNISVVIPVYRASHTLRELVARLRDTLDTTDLSYEIVFVDDGSPDDSWAVLSDLKQSDPGRIVAIRLMRNYGQHNATMCGLRHARGALIITMDDDLQNPPEEIPRLLDALQKGDLDLVYGCPADKKHAAWRNLGSVLVNRFYRLVFRSKVTVTSFRAMRRELAQSVFEYDLNYTFLDGLLAWNTERVGTVPVKHNKRVEGRSGYSLGRLVVLALNLFTNFSLLPLQVVSLLGLLVATAGFVAGFYYVALYLSHRIAVPGYASIIVAILVLGGTQLLALGIIGEYLGRLHLNVNRKPQYRERVVLGATEPRSRGDNGTHLRHPATPANSKSSSGG